MSKRGAGVGKTLAVMLGLGIVLGWASIFAIPTLKQLGIPAAAADKLPYLAFVTGVVWGAGTFLSKGAAAAVGYLAAPVVVGAVFGFFGILLGGLLVGFGLSPAAADFVPVGAFALGAALGSAPLVARLLDAVRRAPPR